MLFRKDMPEPTKDTVFIQAVKPSADKAKRRKVRELLGEEIRWFYKDETEAIWLPFKGYDSFVLEFAYRKKHNIPLDDGMKRWEGEAEASNGIVLGGIYQVWDLMLVGGRKITDICRLTRQWMRLHRSTGHPRASL